MQCFLVAVVKRNYNKNTMRVTKTKLVKLQCFDKKRNAVEFYDKQKNEYLNNNDWVLSYENERYSAFSDRVQGRLKVLSIRLKSITV